MPLSSGSHSEKDSILIPEGFELNADLAVAYQLMEFSSESMFLTGRAGTGKSTLLNYFRKTTSKKYIVLASTGLAALQVGGNTIHSFFGLPLRTLIRKDPEIKAWGKGHPRLRLLQQMDTLIIDEVSMVRVDILEAIDHSLRLNMRNDIPFGGKQLIFIGDVFQLPPVVTEQPMAYDDEDPYYTPYFFSAQAFRESKPRIIELKKIYRQQDQDFIYLLNRIRMGIAGQDELDTLNERYDPDGKYEEDFAITLTSVNRIADQVNLEKVIELSTPSYLYTAKAEGNFDERLYPVPSVLQLKTGAQVMMVKNDSKGRWVNGSLGKIEDLSQEEITVRFTDGTIHRVEPVTWENKVYAWDKENNTISFEVLGTYRHFPIRLAWAVTIHKSQGLTFDKVIIDIGKGAFAHGQLYVALSRCKTLEGITLKTKISSSDMIVDEEVERFAGKNGLR